MDRSAWRSAVLQECETGHRTPSGRSDHRHSDGGLPIAGAARTWPGREQAAGRAASADQRAHYTRVRQNAGIAARLTDGDSVIANIHHIPLVPRASDRRCPESATPRFQVTDPPIITSRIRFDPAIHQVVEVRQTRLGVMKPMPAGPDIIIASEFVRRNSL